MSKALYRKYRSKNLDEIVGQEHITDILKRAIQKDKIAHAYLLTGPRGVGKTSIARILAHQINNLPYTDETTHLDIIEIDAASNNSVEDVRDLREKVQIAPVSAARKVYIIDEVHMLSKQAFNALLKTLEEPPAHIVFILATTDADKLPATILSRVQRFNFRPITPADAVKHLKAIAKKEKIAIDDEALQLIAAHGKGSFRDSISLLDQIQHLSDGAISHQNVVELLGLASTATVADLLQAYAAGDIQRVVALLDTAETQGTPAALLADQLIAAIRRDIARTPHLLALLDALLEVHKSAWPAIKLLTALTANTNRDTPAPAPRVVPTTQNSEPPVVAPEHPPKNTPSPDTAPAQHEQPAREEPVQNSDDEADAPETTTGAEQSDDTFDWEQFLAAVKDSGAQGAYVILRGCGHEFAGDTLTIYAINKFNKARLDKTLPELSAALQKNGITATLAIAATAKPPSDETTASIIDIMGGGEEIDAR